MNKLKSVLPGESREFRYNQHRIFYKVAGDPAKPPLVFIHGVGAGASSYEWRHNFAALSANFRVYALDLLGFGLSERPNIEYSARVYLRLLNDFLSEVVGQPANIIAISVSAGYAIQLAAIKPELISKMVLIVPTGANRVTGSGGPSVTGYGSYAVLRWGWIGNNFFNLFASRFAIQGFLERFMYSNKRFITEEMLDYFYLSAHQPGAEHAPLAFFASRLNVEIGATFAKVTQPTLLIWGKESFITPVEDGLSLLKQNTAARLAVFERSKLAVNEERAVMFNKMVAAYLNDPKAEIVVPGGGYKIYHAER